MIKTILSSILAILFVGILSFAIRLWLIENSMNQINSAIKEMGDRNLAHVRTLMNHSQHLGSYRPEPNSDQLPPSDNPQDWHTISNKHHVCHIHKTTLRKVCRQND